MESFAKRITRRRTELRLTQRQVAQRIGVPLSTYKEWEYGRRIQGETIYLKLSEALEISLYALLSGKISPGDEELTQIFQDLVEHLEKVKKLLMSSLK